MPEMKWLDRAENIMKSIAEAMLIFIMLSVCYDVVMRYLFNNPTLWVQEVSEYLLFWLCFLAGAWVLSMDGHVRMGIVVQNLSPKNQNIMNIVTCVLGIIYCAFLVYSGSNWAWSALQRHDLFSNVTQWPVTPIVVAMPIGALFFIPEFVRKLLGSVKFLQTAGQTSGNKA